MFKNRLMAMITLVAFCIMALFAVAFADNNFPWTKNKQLINNMATSSAPDKGKSGCVTHTGTKGTFGTYTSIDGYTRYEGEVVTDAGIAEPVKWKLDGTQVKVGPNADFINSGGNTYARATQEIYSGASRTLTGCFRRR